MFSTTRRSGALGGGQGPGLLSTTRKSGAVCFVPHPPQPHRPAHERALHPGPCTLDPAPWTLHPGPCTLDPGPWTLHPGPWTLHPGPCTLDPEPWTLHPMHPMSSLIRCRPHSSHTPSRTETRHELRHWCLTWACYSHTDERVADLPKQETFNGSPSR